MIRQTTSPFAGPLATSHTPAGARLEASSGTLGDATQPPSPASSSSARKPSHARRLGQQQLVALADRLPERERQIVHTVERFRLLQVDQIRRLFFHDITSSAGSARVCRRSLAQLTDAGISHRLQRRVGGAKAGSSGNVYALTPTGRRLIGYWAGSGMVSDRGVHEPGAGFLEHTLQSAGLYVALIEADRAGVLELLGFDAEPASWRTYTTPVGATGIVKPDAHVRVGAGEYEHISFVEIDRATQARGALLRKMRGYLALYRSGRIQAATGMFPRVVFITPSPVRAGFIGELLTGLPAESRRLFAVTTTGEALAALVGKEPPAAVERDAR